MDAGVYLLASTIWRGCCFLLFLLPKGNEMTQKEAIIEALKQLGGKAKMSEICKRAQSIGDFSGSKKPDNTIRNCIYVNPDDFRSSDNGWWELVSYQEEIAERDRRIKELEEENAKLRAVKTEDDFVKRLIKATKSQFRFKRNQADAVRQVMDKLGRSDADADLTVWMEGRESKPNVSIGKLEIRQGETNIGTNYGPNIENNGTLSLPNNDGKQ